MILSWRGDGPVAQVAIRAGLLFWAFELEHLPLRCVVGLDPLGVDLRPLLLDYQEGPLVVVLAAVVGAAEHGEEVGGAELLDSIHHALS